jgi:hypothetical protein
LRGTSLIDLRGLRRDDVGLGRVDEGEGEALTHENYEQIDQGTASRRRLVRSIASSTTLVDARREEAASQSNPENLRGNVEQRAQGTASRHRRVSPTTARSYVPTRVMI